MRLIDADELLEHAGRDRLDSRDLIFKMIEDAPTVQLEYFLPSPSVLLRADSFHFLLPPYSIRQTALLIMASETPHDYLVTKSDHRPELLSIQCVYFWLSHSLLT